jgi:hypothetical protein
LRSHGGREFKVQSWETGVSSFAFQVSVRVLRALEQPAVLLVSVRPSDALEEPSFLAFQVPIHLKGVAP